jgi:hypothetical protein
MPLAFLLGCADHSTGYCIAEVSADLQDGTVTGPGFYDPDLVGTTICYDDTVGRSFCSEMGGTFIDVDELEFGAAGWCADEGYPTDCGQNVFVADPAECPAG